MSREVPSGWELLRIGDLCKPASLSVQVSDDEDYDLLGVRWYGNGCHSHSRTKGFELKTRVLNRVRASQIVYNKMWVSKGAFAVVPRDLDGAHATTEYPSFDVRLDRLDPNFIEHYMRQEAFKEDAILLCKGSTSRARLNPSDFLDMTIWLPPLSEQRRIAEILSSVDEAIAATRAVIEQTRKVKQGVLERLLTKGIGHTRFKQTEIGEIPESWEVGPLSRFGKVYTGKTPSTSDDDAWGGDTPFVTPGDLSDECAIVASSTRYVSEHGTRQGRVMPTGAVAVTCIGSTIGKTGILGQQSMTNQQINTICCSKEVSQFVYETCISLRDYLKRISGKQAVPIVNKSTFENIVVAHPPLEEQIEIGKIAAEIEQGRQKQLNTLQRLSLLKSALMSDLLTGRKRVADALPMAAE